MNGSLLKARLQSIEPNLSEAARKLKMSKQAFYQMLEATDIKSGLIERLAALYNRPIGFFFDDCIGDNSQAQIGGSHNNQARGNITNGLSMEDHDELIRLRVEVKMLHERVAEVQKAYENLHRSYEHLQKMNEYLMEQK